MKDAVSRAARPSPYSKTSPRKSSPRKRLAVGGELPVLSPEQQTSLQNELLPGAGLTIAQLREMCKLEGLAQTDAARMRTAAIVNKRRAGPLVPVPITAEQRARGRLLRYVSLYEDEYREDILEYMYRLQEVTMPSRSAMEQQTDIDWIMRQALIDFMIELHAIFHLRQETLYLGINILDRYCSRRVVNKKHYQLIGCTAMWIAAKFEDSKDHVPNTGDLRQYCRGVYEETSFMQMEGHVLATIDWELGHPTAEAWFRCMVNTLDRTGSDAAKEMALRQGWVGLAELETHGVPVIMADLTTQCIGRYLMEVMTYQDSLLDVPPCVVAEGALILAKAITFKARERVNESSAALHVARFLHSLLSKNIDGTVTTALFNKFQTAQFENVSQIVAKFYCDGKEANYPQFLEALPDVEEVIAQQEAEKMAAEEAAADAAEFEEGLEEVDVTIDSQAELSLSDSGYGSSPFARKTYKDAPATGRQSVHSSPSPSFSSSPHKACLPEGIPPLVLTSSPTSL